MELNKGTPEKDTVGWCKTGYENVLVCPDRMHMTRLEQIRNESQGATS